MFVPNKFSPHSQNCQEKKSLRWKKIIKLCTNSKSMRIHNKDNNMSKSTTSSKFVVAWEFAPMFMAIFINKVLYFAITHLARLSIEIHLVFTFLSSFEPLVSTMVANFENSKWCLELLQKYWYKDWSNVSIRYTKGKEDNVCTSKFVFWETQCTPKLNGAHVFRICFVTLNLTPWKTLTPSKRNTTSSIAMSIQPKPFSCNRNPTTHFIIFYAFDPPMTWAMDKSNGVCTQLSNAYTCTDNHCWLLIEVISSQLIKRNETLAIATFRAFKTW